MKRIYRLFVICLCQLVFFAQAGWADNGPGTINLDGIWTMPEPEGLEFTTFTADGARYYLYNPATRMFFSSGNGWSTNASLRTFGMEMWLSTATEENAPDGSYELWDNNCNNPDRYTGEHNIFTDAGNSTWVDHATQINYSWSYEVVDGNIRLQNVAFIANNPSFAGTYLGFDGTYITKDNISYDSGHRNAFSAILRHVKPDAAGVSVDWKAVTVDSYESFVNSTNYERYVEGAHRYIASLRLKQALKAAIATGVDCSDALDVYRNTDSSADDLLTIADIVNGLIAEKKAIDAAKQKLSGFVEECEAKGYTETDAAKAVLENGSATVDELNTAYDELNDAFNVWAQEHVSADSGADMTSYIVNPNFDNASYAGWQGTAPNMTGSGSHGPANVPEFWRSNFDTYQDIEGLPVGIYALSAQTSWRGTWEDMENGVTGSRLYVKVGDAETSVPFNNTWSPKNTTPLAGSTSFGTNAGEHSQEVDGVVYYAPNDPSCFRLYAEKGWYDTKVWFKVTEEGIVRIGVALPEQVSYDNWSLFDTFKLTFYGNEGDAWVKYVNEAWGAFPEVSTDGLLVTQQYVDAYEAAKATEHSTISSKVEILQLLGTVEAAYADLQKNIELWKQWQAMCDIAKEKIIDPTLQASETLGILCDYLEDLSERPGMPTVKYNHDLTNEELEAEIAWIQEMIDTIERQANENLKPGDDVTRFLKNPDFEECDVNTPTGEAPGWTVSYDVGNVTAGPLGQGNYDLMVSALGKMNYCFESWHSHDFDVYQEVNGAPEGVYVIEAQGFVRCENSGYYRPDDVDPVDIPIHLYMNNATDVFPNVYSDAAADHGYEYTEVEAWMTEEQGSKLYPNSMGGAAQCFGWGMYKMQTFGLVRDGEVMRIGVKGKMKTDGTENWWCIWDNFKLTYQGYEMDYVVPALEAALSKIDSSQPMGKSVKEKVVALETQAAAAVASEDGKAIFDMLADIYDVVAEVEASVALFKKLQTANERLHSALEEAIYSEIVEQNIIDNGTDLYNQVNTGIEEASFEDSDVDALLEAIGNMIPLLAIDESYYISATDWAILRDAYATMNGNAWYNPWNFDNGSMTVDDVPGVVAYRGKVTDIYLGGNNLSGTFPTALLALENLQILDLSDNRLSGDLSALDDFTVKSPLRELNITNNQFTGNIGAFAAKFVELEYLWAAYNSFETVSPMISTNVNDIDISNQNLLNKDYGLTLSDFLTGTAMQKLPSITTYNHWDRTYSAPSYWSFGMGEWNCYSWRDEGIVYAENAFYGNSGDVAELYLETASGDYSLQATVTFDMGDANFDNAVDVLDLQADVNFLFQDFPQGQMLFNFTAANLWNYDDEINLQDIIKEVNLLLSQTEEQPAGARRNASYDTAAEAIVTANARGELVLNTTQAVAALDLTVDGAQAFELASQLRQQGFACATRQQADGLHIVAYSLNGALMPIGETVLGFFTTQVAPAIVRAILADKGARRISVAVGSETTGIDEIANSKSSNSKWYDLQGRKVSNMSERKAGKGVYVTNGKKVVR